MATAQNNAKAGPPATTRRNHGSRSRILLSLGSAIGLALTVSTAGAEEIGEVSTAFKLLGANHKIVVEAFDDPDVAGVSCFISRAKTGGIKGSLGLAEDTSDASIACRQTGPMPSAEELMLLEEGEQVFKQRTSILFKKIQVVRFYDEARNTLIYLSYSDRLIDGSPKNSLSAVVAMPWPDIEPMPAE